MLTEIFKYILITSLIGTALTAIISFLKPVTQKLFSASWHYSIWLAVFVIMVLPIRFTLPSAKHNTPAVTTAEQIQPQQSTEFQIPANNQAISFTYHYEEPTSIQKYDTAARFITNHMDGLATIWIWGFLTVLLITISAYIRLLHKVHKSSYVISCPEIKRYTKRKVCVRIYPNTSSPFIIGIFRPSLILPDTPLTDDQFENILMHEATHLNRNDILYKWFTALVKALHWFNPVVYYVAKQINTECEISCDMAVVKDMDNAQTIDYVNTILSLLSAVKTKNPPLTTGMTGNKNTLKKRFAMIKSKILMSKKTIIVSCITAVLILGFAICLSGFLNGKWINQHSNTTVELATDKRVGNAFNTLIVGVDRQNRADSIMLIKMTEKQIEGISIPRNTSFGGTTISNILAGEHSDQKVIDAVRQKLDLPITYYAKVKTDFIRDLIDATGGLTVDIPMDMKYDDPYSNLHIDLKKGNSQALNGEQICGLLQFRRSNDGTGYPQGDLDRIKVTQQIAAAFISQNKLSKLIINSKDIIDSINSNIVTNYSIKDFIKDRDLLSGKNFTFYTIPGKASVNNGSFEYEIDIQSFKGMLNPTVKLDNPPQIIINAEENPKDTVSLENTPPTTVSPQPPNTVNTEISIQNSQLEEAQTPNITGFDLSNRFDFASIADAEQYLQSKGKTAVNNNSFKSGNNYLVDDYTFVNNSNEKISNVLCNDKGEISIYFNGNMDSLVDVRFIDSETKDEVNSAIILTGHERIYKFTGLDPSRYYDVELADRTDSEWKIEGQYIIF